MGVSAVKAITCYAEPIRSLHFRHWPRNAVYLDLELRWREPAIDYHTHDEPPLSKPERSRLLYASVTGVALARIDML